MAEVKVKKPVAVKKEEVKVEAVKAAEPVKAEAPKKEAAPAKKAPAKKAPAKKAAAPKKEEVKKAEAPKKEAAPAKKAPAKKAPAKKEELKATVILELAADRQYTNDALIKILKDVWKYDLKKKVSDIKTVEMYVKPYEASVYYKVNGEVEGEFNI